MAHCTWSIVYNPIVGHMHHSMRDPNRDHYARPHLAHRLQDRPLVEPAKIAGQPIPAFLDLLKVYEDRTRYRSPDRAAAAATPTKCPPRTDKLDRRPRQKRPELLAPHARSPLAASSSTTWSTRRFPIMLRCTGAAGPGRSHARLVSLARPCRRSAELLKVQAADEHPRVRLEAVRAPSFFRGADVATAEDVAAESLLQPQDDYLQYTLDKTLQTLDVRRSPNGASRQVAHSLQVSPERRGKMSLRFSPAHLQCLLTTARARAARGEFAAPTRRAARPAADSSCRLASIPFHLHG